MKDVLAYLENLLQPNDTIVLATSGGPDSMCLFHLLCELKEKLNLKLVIAHVNHKLRSISDEEALFVKKECNNYNLIYEYMEIKEYHHDNLENEARQKRYAFFDDLVYKYHANYLFTAHHGDDLIETILMRLTRGSSLKGYSGFHREVDVSNYKIIRPLIMLTKSDILRFMDDNHFSYYIDESNFSDKITRNRYRMNVLPFLKKEQKDVHKKFLKFSLELDEANQFINSYIENLLKQISDSKGIKIEELLKLDNFLLKKVVEYTLSSIYVNDLFLIHDMHTELIIGLIRSNKSNVSVDLPNGYQAVKNYQYFKIIHANNKKEYCYELNDSVSLPNGRVIKKVLESNRKSNYVIRLNSKDLKLPLFVRTRKDGDKMEVKNLGGSKKVKSIFIDEKIEKSIRDDIPEVIDSDNQILWLPGVKKSKFDVERDGIYDIILSYEEENK